MTAAGKESKSDLLTTYSQCIPFPYLRVHLTFLATGFFNLGQSYVYTYTTIKPVPSLATNDHKFSSYMLHGELNYLFLGWLGIRWTLLFIYHTYNALPTNL